MAKLVFNVANVRQLIEHSQNATTWRKTFGQRGQPKPGLLLVKDHGIYLMSNGLPALMMPGHTDRNIIVYANGYDDTADYDKIVDAAGGDDFCEFIPLAGWAATIVDNNCAAFWITLSSKSLSIGYQHRRGSPMRPQPTAAPVI